MTIIIKIATLVISTLLVLFLYHWSSILKKLGTITNVELNEAAESSEDQVSNSETKIINYLFTILFILIGMILWTFLGITVGKIASEITTHSILKYVVYLLMYFLFLRFPFGAGNKMVKRSFNFKRFPEQFIFYLAMLGAYIFAINYFDLLPQFLKWHLVFLNS